MDKPEALRLADWCEAHSSGIYRPSAEAAAELRRLAAVEAQRDALLEALKAAVADWDTEVSKGRWLDAARAAIKAVEEGK